jgi:hypothetical protein
MKNVRPEDTVNENDETPPTDADVREAIVQHTILMLAGTVGFERDYAMHNRCNQLAGMVELACRLALPASLIEFLKAEFEAMARRCAEREAAARARP